MMRKPYILMVKDSPDDADLMFHALHKSSARSKIATVRDGKEALDFLFGLGSYSDRDTTHTPSLILFDLKSPRDREDDILCRLRSDSRTMLIPMVVFTSSSEEDDVLWCYESGANSYIRKPDDSTQFAEVVHQLGTYWLRLNEPPPYDGGII